MSETCPNCGQRGLGGNPHGAVEAARCALASAARNDLRDLAASLDKPPPPPAVDDLWAHLRSVYEDGALAHRAGRLILELGWRPSVGTDGAR